jgi:AcrR family transcriptional regulator
VDGRQPVEGRQEARDSVSQPKRSSARPAAEADDGSDGRRGGGSGGAAEGKGQTRTLILDAAEWLFAEHGVASISNRQIGAAAGQGNTSAVGYYFGSKEELVRALIRRFEEGAAALRTEMLSRVKDSAQVRDWVECLVYPYTETLAARRPPTWYARMNAQIVADPVLRKIAIEETATPSFLQVIDGLGRSLPALPAAVRDERAAMARHIIVQTCADYERALADGLPARGRTWRKLGAWLADAVAALWTAPVST